MRASAPETAAAREARSRCERGFVLYDRGEPALAYAEFERAAALAPTRAVACGLGLAAFELGDFVEATRELDACLGGTSGAEVGSGEPAEVPAPEAEAPPRHASSSRVASTKSPSSKAARPSPH
ncbi:hypothetical protein EON77_17710, partial [bacterium]